MVPVITFDFDVPVLQVIKGDAYLYLGFLFVLVRTAADCPTLGILFFVSTNTAGLVYT